MKMMILTRAGATTFAARARRQNPSSIVARVVASAAVIAALVCDTEPAAAQFTQQGPKLVGSGAVGSQAMQGSSVAVSADGNTALIGGPDDNSGTGAAWVFTRSNGVWTQQGSKLVGTGVVDIGAPALSFSVALSGDGNTAIIGRPADNSFVGAAWVFTRSNGMWTQQGDKLVGTGAAGTFLTVQGTSVALSADGNTAVVGGPGDNAGLGAAWVFTRSNGLWTQQGGKLVGTGAIGPPNIGQARSVALSADGNTAIIGGPNDNFPVGAAWVFTRRNGVWTQQGSKLVGTGGLPQPKQGGSVALSSDGNTAIIGGNYDNLYVGAAWVFTRTNGVWTQLGNKLVGTGAAEGTPAEQGTSVALSGDGNTAIVGGPIDNIYVGAAWVFTEPPKPKPKTATHDFNGDGMSDIALRDVRRGNTAIWLMNGATVLSSGELGGAPNSWSIVGQRDFDGDGKADLLWRDHLGNAAIWFMNGIQVASTASLGNFTGWAVVGTGDFDGDGKGDILWRNTWNYAPAIWLMDGARVRSAVGLGVVPANWSVAGTGDFNGDGKADILWRDTSGNVAIWEMNGTSVSNANSSFVANVPRQWSIKGTGDFNGDGMSDILWQDTFGNVAIWEMNGTSILNQNSSFVATVSSPWSIQLTGDFNGDGMSDVLWQDTLGNTIMWFMNGTVATAEAVGNIPTNWVVQSVNAE
jgi:FG-GAP-like repeat/FG-GAP repeat